MLESFDVGEPQSWEEFIAMLEKFKAAGLIPLTTGHRGWSQIQLIHYQLWASIGGLSGPGKQHRCHIRRWADLPIHRAVEAAQSHSRSLQEWSCSIRMCYRSPRTMAMNASSRGRPP